jgi:predicted RNase H-like HicB family nuclease
MNWITIFKSLIRRCAETQQVYPDSVLKVIFRPGEDGYIIAECPQLPGCMSQGRTKDEANRNIIDAIKSVLMVRMKQFLSEAAPLERDYCDVEEEESFRIKGPDLISV